MKIVLTHEVDTLGSPGDVVEVADGYARNFLIPRGFALRATPGVIAQVDKMRRMREVREVKNLDQANELADQLKGLTVRVEAKAGDGGRLFGQVTTRQIADAISKAGGPKVDPRRIQTKGPIKNLGSHEVSIKLHTEVEAATSIDVIKA